MAADCINIVTPMYKTRCSWVVLDKPDYVDYHDLEWGVPVHNDNKHFEMLILEGALTDELLNSTLKNDIYIM